MIKKTKKVGYTERSEKFSPKKLPRSIKRELYLYYGISGYSAGELTVWDFELSKGDMDRVLIGRGDVEMFTDTKLDLKARVLQVLQDEREKIQAEFHMKLKGNQDKIDNLLAIEYKPEE